jgi:hypothetical protein
MITRPNAVVSLLLILTLSIGCANSNSPSYKTDVPQPNFSYVGLKGRKCAVMVFADWATRAEYTQIQLDTGRSLTSKLKLMFPAAPDGKKDEKKSESTGTEFLDPASVVRYQRERPEMAGKPIIEVAPQLGVSRVVYVEFEDFAAQSPHSVLMLKGMAKVTLRVVEVEEGKAKIAFEEPGIIALFPSEAPEGVVASEKYNVRTIYEGTLNRLTDLLAVRFQGE